MPAKSIFHFAGAEPVGFAPVQACIPKEEFRGSRSAELRFSPIVLGSAAVPDAARLLFPPTLSGNRPRVAVTRRNIGICNSLAVLAGICRRIFTGQLESRFHLRGAWNYRMLLSISRLPARLSGILNSLSEVLTELPGALRGSGSKCLFVKMLLISNLRREKAACEVAFLGLAQALRIVGQNQVLK